MSAGRSFVTYFKSDASGFTKGVNEMQEKLKGLNTALKNNQKEQKEASKNITSAEKEIAKINKQIEKNGQAKATVVLEEAEKKLAAYEGIGVRKVIEHGSSAADKIVDLAETGKHDAIVMGSQGLSNLKRFLMGSVSTRVSQYAPCTVILVR